MSSMIHATVHWCKVYWSLLVTMNALQSDSMWLSVSRALWSKICTEIPGILARQIVTLTTLSCSYWVEYSSQVIAPQTETSKWGLGFLSVHTKLPASLCLNSKQLSFSLWTDSGLISDRSLTTNHKMTWRAVFLSNWILAGCSMNHLVPWLWNSKWLIGHGQYSAILKAPRVPRLKCALQF